MTFKVEGKNRMHLSVATVIKIVQAWLDKETNIEGLVTNVDYHPSEGYFSIYVEQTPEPPYGGGPIIG